MQITFKYRMYPTKHQEQKLLSWFDECRRLWNALVSDVEDERHLCATLLTETEIRQRLRDISKTRYTRFVKNTKHLDYFGTPTHFLNGIIQTYQKSLENFWRGAGYPKRKKSGYYTSVTWQMGPDDIERDLILGYVSTPKLGAIRVKVHRPFRGKIGTYPRITIGSDGHFYLVVSSEVEPILYPKSGKTAGIDLGLHHAYATSDLSDAPHSRPRWFFAYERRLRVLQRKVSRRFLGVGEKQTKGWYKAVRDVTSLHAKVARQRADWQHKESKSLVVRYDSVGMESGNLQSWLSSTRRGIAKSTADAAPGALRQKIAYKAELYGKKFVQVNWDYTSQTCPCGKIRKKKLDERIHRCDPTCPWNGLDRDVVAAIEIHRRSLQSDGTGERVGQIRQTPRKAKGQPVRNLSLGTTHHANDPVVLPTAGVARNNEINNLVEKTPIITQHRQRQEDSARKSTCNCRSINILYGAP